MTKEKENSSPYVDSTQQLFIKENADLQVNYTRWYLLNNSYLYLKYP